MIPYKIDEQKTFLPRMQSCHEEGKKVGLDSRQLEGIVIPMPVKNINALDAFEEIQKNAHDAFLIDVRTKAEWCFVGTPSLPPPCYQPLFIEWQSYPDMSVSTDFGHDLDKELQKRGATEKSLLFFICRSGQRSHAAAVLMRKSSYENCYNIVDGFEGRLNAQGHRNALEGWRYHKLPWAQG